MVRETIYSGENNFFFIYLNWQGINCLYIFTSIPTDRCCFQPWCENIPFPGTGDEYLCKVLGISGEWRLNLYKTFRSSTLRCGGYCWSVVRKNIRVWKRGGSEKSSLRQDIDIVTMNSHHLQYLHWVKNGPINSQVWMGKVGAGNSRHPSWTICYWLKDSGRQNCCLQCIYWWPHQGEFQYRDHTNDPG